MGGEGVGRDERAVDLDALAVSMQVGLGVEADAVAGGAQDALQHGGRGPLPFVPATTATG